MEDPTLHDPWYCTNCGNLLTDHESEADKTVCDRCTGIKEED